MPKYSVIVSFLLMGFLGVSSQAMPFDPNGKFDLKANYDDINFGIITIPDCGVESGHALPLPADPKAELYYQAARKIFGQNDTDNYKQMHILGEKAVEMGHLQAKLFMAELYLKSSSSYYTEYNPTKAKEYIMDLMGQNVPAAFYAMSQYKLSGVPAFVNTPAPASVYLFQAAKLNDVDALSDMYDVFRSVARVKDATSFLECAVKQQDSANANVAFYKMANVLADQASTEEEWKEAFKYLYRAAKAGNYDAVRDFANKEYIYHQLFSKDFFSKEFLERVKIVQQAMNPQYRMLDPYRQAKDINAEVRGNILLTFPHLERILPFPPAKLSDWDGDVSVTFDKDGLAIYQTDFDYNELVKEAQLSKPEVKEANQ